MQKTEFKIDTWRLTFNIIEYHLIKNVLFGLFKVLAEVHCQPVKTVRIFFSIGMQIPLYWL